MRVTPKRFALCCAAFTLPEASRLHKYVFESSFTLVQLAQASIRRPLISYLRTKLPHCLDRHAYTTTKHHAWEPPRRPYLQTARLDSTSTQRAGGTPQPETYLEGGGAMADARSTSTTSSGKRKRIAYYAVKNGHKPGIYYSWGDVVEQITGYKDPKRAHIHL